jgi:adenosine deaminase CECR1
MIDEKVMYAELRPMLLDKSIPSNDGTKKISNADQMRLIVECVEKKKRDLEAVNELDKFPFGFKIIYCTPRSIPKKMMQEELKQCIELKEQFPDLICGKRYMAVYTQLSANLNTGFDLVGAEDRPNHIGHYKEELVAFKDTCKAKGFNIPFLFHAGETLLDTGGSSDPRNSNLYDAVVLGAERIGHGFSLMKHPQMVVDKFKRTKDSKGICVELCPISNELLHLCRNIKEHPFPEFLAAGVPCTINSDNPSLFRFVSSSCSTSCIGLSLTQNSNSMSHEFYQVMVGAPTMTLYSWKQLAHWSIEYSYLSPGEKERAYAILDKDWNEFCTGVVNDYGSLMKGGVLNEEETKAAYRKMLQRSDEKISS